MRPLLTLQNLVEFTPNKNPYAGENVSSIPVVKMSKIVEFNSPKVANCDFSTKSVPD
jgi:hypothetical protein